MIAFERFELENGLRVIVHQDTSTPFATLNLLYDIGSRDEDPEHTGFAHLFEHLMFGGSVNVPSYDMPVQMAGGSNNAFTSSDITNYYINLPAVNIETAFWVESDRMLSLAFTPKSLEVQRNVVVEEFRQRYLNQPYGDMILNLLPLVYKVHPYRWSPIGREVAHIENATLDQVKDFFFKHYAPNNAILTITGNVDPSEMLLLATKWFGPIPRREVPRRELPQEPEQTQARVLHLERDVPVDAFYRAYPTCAKSHPDFYALDLLSDVLSQGDSSRLYQALVQEQRVFSSLGAGLFDNRDPGLLLASGKLAPGVSFEQAEAALEAELDKVRHELVSERELQKIKNAVEANRTFSEMSILHKAISLAKHELSGGAERINEVVERYLAVSREDILRVAQRYLRPERANTLYYHSQPKA